MDTFPSQVGQIGKFLINLFRLLRELADKQRHRFGVCGTICIDESAAPLSDGSSYEREALSNCVRLARQGQRADRQVFMPITEL